MDEEAARDLFNIVASALDDLLERARGTIDPEARAGLYRLAHERFAEICPAITLFHRRHFILQSPRVDGVQMYPVLPTVRPRAEWPCMEPSLPRVDSGRYHP